MCIYSVCICAFLWNACTSVQWNTSSEIPPIKCTFFVVQLLSHVQLSVTPWTAACHASLSFTPCFPVLHCLWVFSDSCLLSQWCHATISSSFAPFSFCFQFFPAIRVFFQWVSSSHHVAKLLELQLQHQSFQRIFRVDFLKGWLVWYPCSPRNSQESSPAAHFESISSLALSLKNALKLIKTKKRN